MDPEIKQENFAAGLLGAFLGSLLGVGCILLLSRLGYVAAVSGIVMAHCALKGYEKGAGLISKKGAAAAIILVLVMTWLANQFDFALSLSLSYGIPVWDVFLAVPALLLGGSVNSGAFWGNLALLYVFTLLGAVPVLRAGMTGSLTTRTAEEGMPAPSAAHQAVFYTPVKGWIKPLRTGFYLAAVLELVLGAGFLIIGGLAGNTVLMVVGGVVMYAAIFFWIFGLGKIQYNGIIFGWIDGTLWRFQLSMLNNLYHFTDSRVNMTSIFWYKLKPEERGRAQEAALRMAAPSDASAQQIIGGPSLAASTNLAALPLYALMVEKETKWYWKVSYETETGKRRRLVIYKIYPGFAPTGDRQPADGTLPVQWSPCLVALGLGVLGWLIALLF